MKKSRIVRSLQSLGITCIAVDTADPDGRLTSYRETKSYNERGREGMREIKIENERNRVREREQRRQIERQIQTAIDWIKWS
jgi:hypothetical protein